MFKFTVKKITIKCLDNKNNLLFFTAWQLPKGAIRLIKHPTDIYYESINLIKPFRDTDRVLNIQLDDVNSEMDYQDVVNSVSKSINDYGVTPAITKTLKLLREVADKYS